MISKADLFEARFGLPPDNDGGAEVPGDLAKLLGRRVCRDYKAARISDGDLEVLLACAQSAPAKSDLQQFSIILASDDQRDIVSDLIGSMPWIKDAGHFLLFCGDMHRGQRITAWKGKPHENNTLDTFMNAAVDGAVAMMALISCAGMAGYGTCPVSAVRAHMVDFIDLIGLPDGVFPIAGLSLGVPASDGHVSLRLPPDVVVHRGRYDDTGMERALEAYDARRLARHPYHRQMHAETFGETEPYGWSENTARRLAKRERDDFGVVIRARGFKLD